MKPSHNYGELYKLFGYRKKLDRPLIFEALLYADVFFICLTLPKRLI